MPLLAGGDRWVVGMQALAREDPPWLVALVLLRGQGFVVVAAAALLVLAYERIVAIEGSIPASDWVRPATAVLCLLTVRYVIVDSLRVPPARPGRVAKATRDTIPIEPAEPGHGTLRLTLLYDGQPLASVATDAYVTLRNVNMKEQRGLSLSAPVADGSITLPDVPVGSYVASIILDADPENGLDGTNAMPGDYAGYLGGIAVRSAETVTGAVPMSAMLRLLAPEDTRFPIPFNSQGCSDLTSPVGFEWASVPHATRYRWAVYRIWRDGKTLKNDLVEGGTTSATSAGPVALSPSTPGENYALDLAAEGGSGALTQFAIPRKGVLRHFGYCFVVR
jgi:hypothetical protein